MKRAQKIFKKTRPSDTVEKDSSRSNFCNGGFDDDEIQSLKQKILSLEHEIKSIRKRHEFRKETLLNLVNITEQSCQKLQVDLSNSKREQCMVKSEHMRAQLDQQQAQLNTKISTQYGKRSTNTLCRIIATDRKWLEAEMLKRASAVEATTQKRETEFAKIKQRLYKNVK